MPRLGLVGGGAVDLSSVAGVDTVQIGPLDHGLKAWTYDPAAGANTSTAVPTGGLLHLVKLWTRSAQQISSATVIAATAGAGLTGVGFGLWSAAGTLLTSSVNANGATAAAFQGTGAKQVTFAPQTINGGFYVGFWFVGTTGPALIRSSNLNALANIGLSAPNLRYATADTGLTTAAPASLAAQTALTTAYWLAAA